MIAFPNLILGLLDTSAEFGDGQLADRIRGLTIAWTRYGYQGDVIESDSIDKILEAAAATPARYSFILPYGFVVYERWKLEGTGPRDFFEAISQWIDAHDFLVAGTLAGNVDGGYGFERHGLLVNLDEYRRLGRPAFGAASTQRHAIPLAEPRARDGRLIQLFPTDQTVTIQPQRSGWHLIAASLNARLPVVSLGDEPLRHLLDLGATCAKRRSALAARIGAGISGDPLDSADRTLTEDQCRFLNVIRNQAENARRGVFLWNIEPYADIEVPSEEFAPPLSTLYSVAAGFKPNRILHTHRFSDRTRVVFFDYSQRALDVRQFMVSRWNGEDFPRFVREVFQAFPHPETFYQLWDEMTPDDDIWRDIDRIWEQELTRWGGASAFTLHWRRYRQLRHDYVCCNILEDALPLLDLVRSEPNAIIWWSNAFFTMYGNWFYTTNQRQQAYRCWMSELAARNADLFLLGSDDNNTCVNSIRAGEYWELYRTAKASCLRPHKLHRTEIRM